MNRDLIGYLLGFIIFIIGIPYLMYWVSGSPNLFEIDLICFLLFIILAIIGIELSVWSIIYMKDVGGGNPFDAFNHEVAPRTTKLMTDGPYAICRNPMLLGVFIYHFGILIAFFSILGVIIFLIEIYIMNIQVKKEEQRLIRDFGRNYEEYARNTQRFLPKIKW